MSVRAFSSCRNRGIVVSGRKLNVRREDVVFDELREAFRQAVENFKTELDRDRVSEEVDGLVAGMRQEVVDARAYLDHLEEEIQASLERARAEEDEAKTCRRREQMAREIGDEETAGVAARYAEKHEKRRKVLERKALALKEELDLRRNELREMVDRLKEARTSRDGLAARAGRTRARESLGEADDLFAELDRMAEKIDDAERRGQAAEELDSELDPGAAPDPADPEAAADARLRELKRRMGMEE